MNENRDISNRLNFGVYFDEKHSYDDFGLFFCKRTISPPEPQTNYIEVPGRNGVIDMSTALTGSVKYKTRTISMTFRKFDIDYENYDVLRTTIMDAIHGKRMQIVFDDDGQYYYSGVLSVGAFKEVGRRVCEFTITANSVQPYKYNRTSSDEGWLWDPFDFVTGVIPGLTTTDAPGTIEFVPEVYTESFVVKASGNVSNLVMEVNGKSYSLSAGKNTLYGVPLEAGVTNTLTFTGSGHVSVSYRGGTF